MFADLSEEADHAGLPVPEVLADNTEEGAFQGNPFDDAPLEVVNEPASAKPDAPAAPEQPASADFLFEDDAPAAQAPVELSTGEVVASTGNEAEADEAEVTAAASSLEFPFGEAAAATAALDETRPQGISAESRLEPMMESAGLEVQSMGR